MRSRFSGFQEIATVLIALQWAYLVASYGYMRWGWVGAAIGLVSSPALLPFAPFTAWMHPVDSAVYWFYGLLAVWVAATGAQYLATPKIYDESGRRIS